MYEEYGSHEDWNPMEEAYFNERFNTYESGPGADLDRSLQPCFRRRNDVQRPLCKLYVHKIPGNLTEEGLRNLFLKFGSPRSVFLNNKPNINNLSWALVEYSTVSEAQEAINSLNCRPPLNLGVQFARGDEEKERRKRDDEQEKMFRKTRYPRDAYDLPEMESPYPRAIGRGRGVPVSAPAMNAYYCNKPYRMDDDELMFRKPIAKGVFSPYRGSVWDAANVHVIDSLTVNSSEEGRRISMGRALPSIEPRRRRLQNHKFALQRTDLDQNDLRIGLCVYCSDPSLYSCERCGAWYCSEECQAVDWPMHKEICMPYLCKKLDNSLGRTSPGSPEVMLEEKKKSGQLRKGGQRKDEGDNRLKGRESEEGRNRQMEGGRVEGMNRQMEGGRVEGMNRQMEGGRVEGMNRQMEGGRVEGMNRQMEGGRVEGMNRQTEGGRGEGRHRQTEGGRGGGSSRQMEGGRGEGRHRQMEGGRGEGRHRQTEGGRGGGSSRQMEGGRGEGRHLQTEGGRGGGSSRQMEGDRGEVMNRQMEGGRGEGRHRQMEGGRGEGRHRQTEGGRGGGSSRQMEGDRGEVMNRQMEGGRGEGRHRQMEGGRGEGRNRQMEGSRGEGRREGEGWKNVERKGNRIPPLLSSPEDDWDKSSSEPRKSELMVEKKELSSEDSNRISQTIDLPHVKSTMSSSAPRKSELMVEKKELSSEDTNRISQTIKLPHEKFTMVSVGSVLSPGHYWVQSKDEEKDLISIMKIMNDGGKQAKKPVNLKAGDFCLAMFEGFPYRAKVLFVRSDEVEVFFVDFGNTDTCNISNIGELPSDAWNYKSQAIEIVMAEQTPQEYLSLSENDVVSVKPVSERNWKTVKVEGVKYEEIERPPKVMADDKIGRNSSEKVRMQWPKSVLGLVKEGMSVVCDVFDVTNEEKAILGMAFEDVAEDLGTVFRDFPSKCSESILDETFKPKVGDLIAGTTGDENWMRGVVLSEESTGWMVAFCDAGSMCVVKNLRKMPDGVKYREAPAFAVQCTVLKSFLPKKDLYSENRIMISSKLHLKIVACNGEEVVADMLTKDKELFCKVKLEAWRPEVQSDLSCQVLNDGDKVLIVSYFNTAAIFVQAADEVSQKKIQSLLQDVAGDCVDGKGKMNEAPSKGTVVACKFSGDGNYYRALVMDVKEGNQLFVSYVDFGNQEWAPLENVQRLSDELKKIPCYAVKIGLKVSGVSQLTGDAARLLNTLVLNGEELKIVIPDGDLRNCELLTKSGNSLNAKIAGLVDPSKSSITNTEGRIKWTSDMVGKLEIPEGGSLSLKFLILHCPGKCTVVGCPAEDPRIEHVYKTFPAEMSELCEKCPQVPYVPVAYELCMAKFTDGSWYRGFAADAKGDESLIYFVDFGNWMKVKHKDIRKMVPEFMKVPFIAILCTYKGFEEETISKEQENALKQYLKPNTLFLASISQEQGPDEYILDIPEVTQKLKSLLP